MGPEPSLAEFAPHFWAAFYGYVSLLEAVTSHIDSSAALPNLTALGL